MIYRWSVYSQCSISEVYLVLLCSTDRRAITGILTCVVSDLSLKYTLYNQCCTTEVCSQYCITEVRSQWCSNIRSQYCLNVMHYWVLYLAVYVGIMKSVVCYCPHLTKHNKCNFSNCVLLPKRFESWLKFTSKDDMKCSAIWLYSSLWVTYCVYQMKLLFFIWQNTIPADGVVWFINSL